MENVTFNIKVYYSNSTNDVSWQFPLSQKESNTFNSLYHPRCAQGYLEFLPPNPSQCANANDIYLHVQKLHDVQICEQKFSDYLRIHYYFTKAIIVLVFENGISTSTLHQMEMQIYKLLLSCFILS